MGGFSIFKFRRLLDSEKLFFCFYFLALLFLRTFFSLLIIPTFFPPSHAQKYSGLHNMEAVSIINSNLNFPAIRLPRRKGFSVMKQKLFLQDHDLPKKGQYFYFKKNKKKLVFWRDLTMSGFILRLDKEQLTTMTLAALAAFWPPLGFQ